MIPFYSNFFAGWPEFSNQFPLLILIDMQIVIFPYYDEIATLLSG